MASPMRDSHFRLMSIAFRLRDLFLPPRAVLRETGLKAGAVVLDFGCGPGSYTLASAELAGETGKVYALDIHPLALEKVGKNAARKGLTNIQTIHSGCETDLPDESVDIALMFDVIHELDDAGRIFREIHRVLKPKGVVWVSDHHLKENELIGTLTSGGFFRLIDGPRAKRKKLYRFKKNL